MNMETIFERYGRATGPIVECPYEWFAVMSYLSQEGLAGPGGAWGGGAWPILLGREFRCEWPVQEEIDTEFVGKVVAALRQYERLNGPLNLSRA